MPAPLKGLVGRAEEFAILQQALLAAAIGSPSTVILSGEAGIGKTRLCQELISQARTEGFVTTVGRCSPVSGSRIPYGPVVDLLDALLRRDPGLPSRVPAEVWRSVAWLTGAAGDPAVSGARDVAAARLFAGFTELVGTASRRAPVLVVIEDVHWIDSASLALLVFAVRKLRSARILLLVTNRPEDARTALPVRAALAEMRRAPDTVDVTLGPLSAQAMAELLEPFTGLSDAHAVARIGAVSDGNPFFALHLAIHGRGRVIPSSLRDILLPTLDGLSDRERGLLILVAVLGDTYDSSILLTTSGSSPAEFNQAARNLVDRGLLVERNGSITFRHALLREITVGDTIPSERVLAHWQIATALMALPLRVRSKRAAEIAYHLMGSGRQDEALDFAVQGARQAAAVWAFADARQLFSQVRELWDSTENPENASGLPYPALLREAGLVSRWCGELDEALALIDQALAWPNVSTELLIDLDQTRGQVLWAAGDMGSALEAYQRAASRLPAIGESVPDQQLRASVLAALALGLMATGNAQRAAETARAAIAVASTAGAERERIHASVTLAVSDAQLGDVDSAVTALRQCLVEARRLDDLELVVRCYGNLTFALGIACRYDDVAKVAQEGLDVCKRYGPIVALASNMVANQVSALISLGRWLEARTVAENALVETTAAGGALYLRTRLAEVAIALGDLAEADAQIAQAAVIADAGNPYTLAAQAAVRAERALTVDDPAAAIAVVAEALPLLQMQDDALPVLEVCWLGLRAQADLAEVQIPSRRATAADPRQLNFWAVASRAASRSDLPVSKTLFLTCDAEAARITATDTEDQWSRARAGNVLLDRPGAAAYCGFRLGAVQLRGRARAAAAASLADALHVAEHLGAVPLISQITTLCTVSGLRLDGAAQPVKTAPATDGLTPREREVLTLLVNGATNRLIARSLFISERTASVHVSNIMAKFGAANRTEAARIAVRLKML